MKFTSLQTCVRLNHLIDLLILSNSQATVGAIGIVSKNHRLYSALPILVSGQCGRESGREHAKLLDVVLQGSKATTLRKICISFDGESRRGQSLVILTMKHDLEPMSPIYPLLNNLSLMNQEVGPDDITCDKDYKHVLKRFRNLTLRSRGFKVHGVQIYTSVLWAHLRQNGVPNSHIKSILKPDDKQDVKLAYDLLHDIWSLPTITNLPPSLSAGFQAKHEALATVGKLFQHILLPYICIDLTLSEQLIHLSAAAHMFLAMLHEDKAGILLMPTQLYINVQIMIKNVYFCVAKTKIDNPNGKCWIIVIGTDRLEDKFRIVRIMTGNDTSVDILQLGIRLTGITEVSAIFAQHPEWDRSPRRLKLPALSKDGLDIHKGVDHINPASWRGNVEVSKVNLQTCWMLGRREVDKIPCLGKVLADLEAEKNPEVNMLQPFGKDIVCTT